MTNRYLTKSRFTLAMQCPTKLYYTGKREYINQNIDDTFLLALAEGGFQVGELAKHYFAGGHDIETLDYKEALQQTNELLLEDNVIIYEAAIAYGNFFIRTDVLIKKGDNIELIEVKAKSIKSSDELYNKKRDKLIPDWSRYLQDVAFQKYVLSKAFPEHTITAHLMVANKEAKCPTDGLNQKFRVIEENGRKRVKVLDDLSEEDLNPPILLKVNVDDACEMILAIKEGYRYERIWGRVNF